MASRLLLLDVDTQIDFMDPRGALYVPGAERLGSRLSALLAAAAEAGVAHWSTLDTHTPDDPEFAAYGFPAHCVEGTHGWLKVAATKPRRPHLAAVVDEETLAQRELLFTKHTFDIFSNPRFVEAIARYVPGEVIVCGVATDYCVKAAVLGLLAEGLKVTVAEDAIAAVAEETGGAAIAEMAAAGAKFAPVSELVARLGREAAHVA